MHIYIRTKGRLQSQISLSNFLWTPHWETFHILSTYNEAFELSLKYFKNHIYLGLPDIFVGQLHLMVVSSQREIDISNSTTSPARFKNPDRFRIPPSSSSPQPPLVIFVSFNRKTYGGCLNPLLQLTARHQPQPHQPHLETHPLKIHYISSVTYSLKRAIYTFLPGKEQIHRPENLGNQLGYSFSWK